MNSSKALILILVSILVTAFATYSYAVSTLTAPTISGGVYPGAPAFTVWTEGGVYYAKNQNGAITYNGTDAATVIQSAMDNGYSVFITAGTYFISTNLDPASNVEVYGDGITTKLVAATTGITIFEGSSISNFTLRDMWLQGYGSGNSINVYLIGTSNSTLSNLRVTNAGRYGVYLQTNCYYNIVTNNRFLNNGWSGICLSGGTDPNTVEYNIVKGNTASNNGWHGIQLGERSNHNVISDNICVSNGWNSPGDGSGIIVGNSQENTVTGNNCFNNTDAGIWVEDGAGFNIVSGNNVYSTITGIRLYGTSNNTIIGNTIRSNGVGATSDGILIYHASIINTNNIIEANMIYNFGRAGILINGATDTYNTVTNNKCMDNKEWGIRDEGDYNIFVGDYATGNVVGGIKTAGANTKVNLCYNGTSWIS